MLPLFLSPFPHPSALFLRNLEASFVSQCALEKNEQPHCLDSPSEKQAVAGAGDEKFLLGQYSLTHAGSFRIPVAARSPELPNPLYAALLYIHPYNKAQPIKQAP